MSYKYSERSLARLSTACSELQLLFMNAIEYIDITIVCAHRNSHDQNEAYEAGNSKLKWPDSNHNEFPSDAVDAVPYPQMWDDKKRFYYVNGILQTLATQQGIILVWGGNWDHDNDFNDQTFMDLGHWEIRR